MQKDARNMLQNLDTKKSVHVHMNTDAETLQEIKNLQ